MIFDKNLLSDPASTGFWAVPLAGFANPMYLGPGGTSAAIGFDISRYKALVFAVENNTAVATLVYEQTNDPTGATGWFPVAGRATDSVATALATNGATPGKAYVIPVLGLRMRFRVTALTTADLRGRVIGCDDLFDLAQGVVSATLNATTNIVGGVIPVQNASVSPLTKHRLAAAAASVNSTLVASGARKLVGGTVHNFAAAVRFLKLYDKATAPTIGADAPTAVIAIPAGTTINLDQACSIYGLPFSLGLGYGLTVLGTDTDTTALTAGDVTLNLIYV